MLQNSMFIYSWCVDEKETEFTKIRIYGIDKDKKNICLHVHDFTPYVYLELPTYTEWNERKAQLLGNKIDQELGEFAPLRKSLIMKYKLYGAHFDKNDKRKKFPYLFCSFAHKSHIDKKLYALTRKSLVVQGIGHVRIKIHESSADPILQMICCRDISSIGWIKFVGEELTDDSKYTLCDKEYNVKWKGIFNADENTVGLPLIMGFDIEVNSTNPTVMPKAKNPGDKVFQISCIFNREGQNDCESYLITLAEAEQKIVGENVKIISCETESELLISFTELVRNKKPNIITGYNILGFDIQYMIDRAKFNLCISKFDQIGFHLYNHSKEKTIKWSSSAYKNQEFSYLDAEGIIFVDLLPLIRRDYKFSSYNLKTVSKEILKDDTKVDLSIPRMFKLYKIGTQKLKDGTYTKKSKKAMGIIGKYCFKDSDLCVKLMQKMQTWVGLTEMAKTCIAAGEYITINNKSVPIETLTNYKNILSWNNENQGLIFNKQINFLDQGTKECIKIYFENGTTLTCTNDHKILNKEGKWVEAGKSKIGDRIKHGLQFPKQNIFDDIKICNNYKFTIGDLIFNTNNYEEYEKSIAFCRILGWLLTDATNSIKTERCRLSIGHKLDVENVLQDIYLLTKKNVKPYEIEHNYIIELPKNLIKNINKCDVIIGKKTENAEKFLDFIMDKNLPLPLLREFLGGLFGGDGHTLTWNSSLKNIYQDFETVKFTRTKIPKLEQNLKEWFADLQTLLLRFNIKTTINRYIKNKNISMVLTILKEDCIKFYDYISFRYCVNKIQKLFIGCSYFQYKNEILRQRNWVIEQTKKYINDGLSRENARIKACNDLIKLEPIINIYSTPTKNQMKWFLNPSRVITSNNVKFSNNPIHLLTAYEYLKNIDALKFFDDNISYGVLKESNFIDAINLKVIDIRNVGFKKVYDITVENDHSFLANGVVCHNCNVGIFSLYTQGQQIKVYSQVYRYCLKNNFVVEKDGYITKEGERYAGAHVFPPVPGLYERVLPFDFCLSGDTLVTMSNGLSKRIKDIENENLVIGFDELNSGYKEFLSINGLQNKGIKNTIKLILQDGRNIICTPEHKFMSDENEWVEAKNLKNKWIKCGIEYPEDIICKKEKEWCLKVKGYEFNMKNNIEREKSLAFARMLGYILSDGTTDIEEFYCKFCNVIISSKNNIERHFNSLTCVKNKKKYEENENIHYEKNRIKKNTKPASFGTIIDAQNFMRDIKRFIEHDISIIKKNGNNNTKRGTTYNITLPVLISKMIHSLDDIVVGKRTIQDMKLPKFIKEENCPDSIIKEFLSGLYGGDGHTTSLSNNKFSKVAFSWYTVENKIDSMKNVFNELKFLHDRIGIKSKICGPVLVKYENSIMIPQDIESNPRYMFKLYIENLNVFYKNISFKYCINKQYKFVIANSYYEYKKISEKTTINNYLKQTKTENWFEKKSYSVKQDDLYIPEYRQKIIDIIENGEENVYDIEVEHAHNFLANGAVAHNCSLYPTT